MVKIERNNVYFFVILGNVRGINDHMFSFLSESPVSILVKEFSTSSVERRSNLLTGMAIAAQIAAEIYTSLHCSEILNLLSALCDVSSKKHGNQ